MGYQELYEPYRREAKERYSLIMERVETILQEQTTPQPFCGYFYKVAEFLLKIHKTATAVRTGEFFNWDLEDLKKWNKKLYQDLLPEFYHESYANPAYTVKMLGTEYGQILCMLYARIRNLTDYMMRDAIYEIAIYAELFVEIYNHFENLEETSPEKIREIIYWFYHDYSQVFQERSVSSMVNPEENFYTEIVTNTDFNDMRYLYRYGSYISENELKVALFFNQMSPEKIQEMADVYTEGYRKGFEVTGKDLSKKSVCEICYPIGFERMVKAAIANFETMGLKPVIRKTVGRRGVSSTPVNEQYDFDHKDDMALYFDKAYVERSLECLRNELEQQKDLAAGYAGPAVIETFGYEPFAPINKQENYFFDEKQQQLNIYLSNMQGQLFNQYIKGEERSFTIIAYPIPEIGEEFEAIFEKTIEINNLDYMKYQKMQQKIIDVLDQAEYVHICGKGDNKTDLKVSIMPLKNLEKETAFENCVADVNIPVGEVFTSPRLKGTTGVLHVTEVYLRQLKYVNLELKFEDGMITEYTCENFESEEENKKFIRENLLHHHESLPMGEFAIGTNTMAYKMGKEFQISGKLPILIAEKTGPHFAVGDTCYTWAEDTPVYNPDGKEIVARDNEVSILRKEEMKKAYFHCHTDITIPYDELDCIVVCTRTGERIPIIENGKFVVEGTEELNIPLEEI